MNIKQIDLLKEFITGIFEKNYELSEIDDEVFIAVIKAGIDRLAIEESPQIINEVLEHAISEYVNIWVESAIEDGVTDLGVERKEARKKFLMYYKEA